MLDDIYIRPNNKYTLNKLQQGCVQRATNIINCTKLYKLSITHECQPKMDKNIDGLFQVN
jgi:hypothetical protein